MAKGNLLLGQASKKLGSVVMFVRNGQQLTRVWTDSGARRGNSASLAARGQRVKFGAAAAMWRNFAYISTRMFRTSKKTTESDYNFFTKRNWQYFPYLTKEENSFGVKTATPGYYSTGNYGEISLYLLHSRDTDSGKPYIVLTDNNRGNLPLVTKEDTYGDLVNAFKIGYPNATKITYAFGFIKNIELQSGSDEFVSSSIDWGTIVIDLTGNTAADLGGNVIDVLKTKTNNSQVKALLTANTRPNVVQYGRLLDVEYSPATDELDGYEILPLFFATNDQANDCYTTSLMPGNFTTAQGPFKEWADKRTQNAFDKACASYGYTSGVMQTDIATSGDDLLEMQTAYVASLAKVNPDLAQAYNLVTEVDGKEAVMLSDEAVCKRCAELEASGKIVRTNMRKSKRKDNGEA